MDKKEIEKSIEDLQFQLDFVMGIEKREPLNYCRMVRMKHIYIVLNYIKQLEKKLEDKDKIINKSIEEIEIIREYFDESCQVEFIGILEILKDKKVIDW